MLAIVSISNLAVGFEFISRGVFPHCLLIVSHLEPFVKRFFRFFFKVAEPATICRLGRSNRFSALKKWLLYPAYPRHSFSLRGLVHICIPHTGTPCGRVMGLKVLPTLVGLSLWDCLALAFCTLIVSQLGGFVKGFFIFFQETF